MKQKKLLPKRKQRFWALLPLLLTVLLAVYLVVGSANVQKSVDDKTLAQLSNTIRRYAAQCYALEGSYPEDLAYLQTHYGLTLDATRYVYHFRNLGANMMPEIAVFALVKTQ
jgi:hypothetical protein